MFDFIFGDTATGKSEYIYDWLVREAANDPEGSYYLFVPEQNTLAAQKKLVNKSPVHGLLNMDVLSFQLLSYRVMDELGIPKPVVLDDVSRSILIRKSAGEVRDELRVFKKKIN